eukprot:1025916-Pyramimonas_sp.AAC.1
MRLHQNLDVWFCLKCGFFTAAAGRLLGRGLRACCPTAPSMTGRDYLQRIARGLWPKVAGRRRFAHAGEGILLGPKKQAARRRAARAAAARAAAASGQAAQPRPMELVALDAEPFPSVGDVSLALGGGAADPRRPVPLGAASS